MSAPCPFLVTVYEPLQKWPPGTGTYEVEIMGFGKPTLEEAREAAAEACAQLDAMPFYPHSIQPGVPHRAAFFRFCDTCGAYGVAPGFKRKPCPACDGKGKTPLT